ncbi:hypothetical protein [Chryseobacterium sp. JUb7]|uniref:hypothetical protein n=1 Tax=Chryseobacterium sp. JUb7 TaxID=2940599 RepID=UPI002166F958|nr:hypothetical protein [Chryseobacterium sp. JUb7]MCS3528682.1 cytochrome bd-type quinol oxidase subunit 2 [Chryseobacterium sp. JUb7]
MIQRVLKDLGLFMATALWGIMTYLQISKYLEVLKSGNCFTYHPLQDWCKVCKFEIDTLKYDNFFIFFFGMFLICYVITLMSILVTPDRTSKIKEQTKKNIKIFLWMLLVFSVLYMISDGYENSLSCRKLIEKGGDFNYLSQLKTIKWVSALFVLFACLYIDWIYFKNYKNIGFRLSILLILIFIVVIGLDIYHYFTEGSFRLKELVDRVFM